MDKTFKPDFLKGKTALVTGGATGICYNIAKGFMKYGCSVCIMSRKQKNIDEAIESLKKANPNSNCYGMTCDVRKFEQIQQTVDFFLTKVEKIDILVNGAAGNFLSSFESLSPNGFKTVIEIDLIGTFQVTKVVYERSMKKYGGNIINISAYLYGSALQIHAGSAKAGVDNITQTLAVELGPKNIRVNGIAPGAIEDTEGFSKLTPQESKSNQSGLLALLPIERFGKKDDIAECALFLASDAASYITGITLNVDGGQKLTFPNLGLLSPAYQKLWKSKL